MRSRPNLLARYAAWQSERFAVQNGFACTQYPWEFSAIFARKSSWIVRGQLRF
jgi:hypothetical protein